MPNIQVEGTKGKTHFGVKGSFKSELMLVKAPRDFEGHCVGFCGNDVQTQFTHTWCQKHLTANCLSG